MFSSWTGDVQSSDNPYTFTVKGSTEIIINFDHKKVTISSLMSPDGFGVVEGVGVYNYEDIVDLKAIPSSGRKFVNWTINGLEVGTEINYQ